MDEFRKAVKDRLEGELKKIRGEITLQNYHLREQLIGLQTQQIAISEKKMTALTELEKIKNDLRNQQLSEEAFRSRVHNYLKEYQEVDLRKYYLNDYNTDFTTSINDPY